MCTAICINDKNRPKEIPQNKWLKKGQEYTIIFTTLCKPQNEIGVHLAEIELDESCSPYEYFMLNRFIFSEENLLLLQELIKNCNDTDFSIEELLEQTVLQEV
jgi:hypothetical protein